VGDGDEVGAWGEFETMDGEGNGVADDSPTKWPVDFRPHPAVAKIAKKSEHPRVSRNGLIGATLQLVWSRQRSPIKPTK
jgi:hypothetical protein